MKDAIQAFSRKGLFKEKISCFAIPSREHARKLWPLVTPEQPHTLVTYVSPSFDKKTNKLKKRSCFARLPAGKSKSVAKQFREEADAWEKKTSESVFHRKAKELIANELSRRVIAQEGLNWCFSDPSRSDFPLMGNLLLGAERIQTEFPFETPFGQKYRLDAAVLGPNVGDQPLILAGIEVEFTNAFDGFKGLISKTLGFPVISIDISEMSIDQISEEWARNVLQTTTYTAEQGLRKTYVYLHDLVYPQFVSYPTGLCRDPKHQFLIFTPDVDTNRLAKNIKVLSRTLGYGEYEVAVTKVNSKSVQSRQQLEDLGLVVGPDWSTINAQQCLRVSVERPKNTEDLRAHRFHTAMAKMLLSELYALVGYKYIGGIQNNDIDEDIWIHEQWMGPDLEPMKHRMLPKRLAEPIHSILELINDIKVTHENLSATIQDDDF